MLEKRNQNERELILKQEQDVQNGATTHRQMLPPDKQGQQEEDATHIVTTWHPQVAQRRSSKARILILSGLLALLILLGSVSMAVWWYSSNAIQSVTVYHVGTQQQVSQDIGGGGIVFPRQRFNLSYPEVERVTDIMVNAGDNVKANQPLIKLDPTQINAQVTQASNDVAAAHAYLNSVSSTGNPVTIAQAQQAYQLAQNRYDALMAETNSSTFHNGTLISPMNGVVTSITINPGESFQANAVLLTLMDLSTVTVHTKIPLANLNQVHVGMPALVTPSSQPDSSIKGIVSAIIPQADAQTDTFEAWIEIDHPQQAVLPGVNAFIRIQSPISAYVVPRLAVLDPDRESVVFVAHNGHVTMQHVHVVGRSANSVYVDTGLTPGEQIVVTPLDSLHDGQKITVTHAER